MIDDRFNVIVHHGGEVEAHEEAAEVEIRDASGLNSDVEVEVKLKWKLCLKVMILAEVNLKIEHFI